MCSIYSYKLVLYKKVLWWLCKTGTEKIIGNEQSQFEGTDQDKDHSQPIISEAMAV